MRKEILQNIGLTGNEAEIYLALLESGPTLVSGIVRKTKINRTNIYDRLERLIQKGLVSYVVKNNRKHFCAAEPGRVLRYLEEKERKIHEDKKAVLQLLPELEKLKPFAQEEDVEVYEGREGLKTILEEIVSSRQDILTYGSKGNFSRILKFYFKHYLKKLEKTGITMNVIFSHAGHKESFGGHWVKVRYIPAKYKTPTETTIFGDKVVIFLLTRQPRAIVISSPAIASSYKKYFRLLWRISRKA